MSEESPFAGETLPPLALIEEERSEVGSKVPYQVQVQNVQQLAQESAQSALKQQFILDAKQQHRLLFLGKAIQCH